MKFILVGAYLTSAYVLSGLVYVGYFLGDGWSCPAGVSDISSFFASKGHTSAGHCLV
jgi:hypothetical protein